MDGEETTSSKEISKPTDLDWVRAKKQMLKECGYEMAVGMLLQSGVRLDECEQILVRQGMSSEEAREAVSLFVSADESI